MFEDFFNKRNELELPADETDLFNLSRVYNKKLKENNFDDEIEKYFIWDYELMSCISKTMIINNYNGDRLAPIYEFENGDKWPDISNFEKQRIKFYASCIENTDNKAMKIRYLDYLVDYGNSKYEHAEQLIEELLEMFKSEKDYHKLFSLVSRAVNIALKFNMENKISEIENILISKADNLIENKNYRWIFEISELLYCIALNRKENNEKRKIVKKIISYLEKSKDYYWDNKKYYLYRSAARLLYDWYKAEDYSNEDIRNLLLEIGESYEKEAEYQQGREEKSNLVKASFLEDALQHYINIGESSKVSEMKSKIKRTYKNLKENEELNIVTTDLEVSNEEMEKEIEKFKLNNINDSLEKLSRTNYFVPTVDQIKKETKEIYKNTISAQLFNVSAMYDNRKVFQSETKEEKFKYNFYRTYDIGLKVNFSLFFSKIWDEFLKEGLTKDIVINRITNWKYVDEESKRLVEIGIKRLFNKDYISSLHILVPQFENWFRQFFEAIEYPTTSIKAKTVQHEQNFNDFLLDDFVEENTQEDLLFFIKFVMVEDLGYNLRNNIAHGLIRFNYLNKEIALTVLYMFFQLTNYEWETQNGEEI